MSRFHTPIPVNIEEIKKLLPLRGVHVHGVSATTTPGQKDAKVVIDWECAELHTGFTFPVEFSVDDLRAKKLPKGVKFVGQKPKAKAPKQDSAPTAPAPTPAPETSPAPVPAPKAKAPAKVKADKKGATEAKQNEPAK